jgi:hypothetical protein
MAYLFGNVPTIIERSSTGFNPEAVVEEGERYNRFLSRSSDPTQIAREYQQVYRAVLGDSLALAGLGVFQG